jgi:hypothetical protein
MSSNAKKLGLYVLAICAVVLVADNLAEYFLGFWFGGIGGIVAIYLVTIFDLKRARPEWALYRRILPSVSAFDCAIYALPFVSLAISMFYMAERPAAFLLVHVAVLLFSSGSLLLRWRAMRRGSRDDLSWLWSMKMPLRERFQRYMEPMGAQIL